MVEAADQGVDVARFQQGFTQGNVFMIERVPACQFHILVLGEIVGGDAAASGVERAAQGNGGQQFGVGVAQNRRAAGEAVEVGRFQRVQPLGPVARQIVGAKRVGDDHNQVQTVAGLLGWLLPLRPARKRVRSIGSRRRGNSRRARGRSRHCALQKTSP